MCIIFKEAERKIEKLKEELKESSEELAIEISDHAKQQMVERGATENEVITAIKSGDSEPARRGRILYRKNFQFNTPFSLHAC